MVRRLQRTLGGGRRRANLTSEVSAAIGRVRTNQIAQSIVVGIWNCSLGYDARAEGSAHEQVVTGRLLHTTHAAPCEFRTSVLTGKCEAALGHLDLLLLGTVRVGF